jgi:ATP-dependent DNA ligase
VAGNGPFLPVRAADGLEAWQQVVERGFEGYVAKDESSRYEGGPTRAWIKVKQRGWTMEEDRWRRTMFEGASRHGKRAHDQRS